LRFGGKKKKNQRGGELTEKEKGCSGLAKGLVKRRRKRRENGLKSLGKTRNKSPPKKGLYPLQENKNSVMEMRNLRKVERRERKNLKKKKGY